MLDNKSVKTRFLVSIASNGIRAIMSFLSGLLIARGLQPSNYGDMAFLLGSFVSIRTLLDVGSSNAFFTFISQKTCSRKHYLFYFLWLGLQFILILFSVTIILPNSLIEKIWVGHSREIIFLAFVASFMQQQAWQTVVQIGEASRKSVRVQIMSLAVAFAHLSVVALFFFLGFLSVKAVFGILIIEYVLATLWAFWFLRRKNESSEHQENKEFNFKKVAQEYWQYCKPIIFLSFVGFLYDFADRWMLQRFGGGSQQGFYQIAYQFAAISLLVTTSILNIFWKEIAEATERLDKERIAYLYHKVSRGLVIVGASLSGLLIPWTEEIVNFLLGKQYVMAAPVLAIMFLFPIHQSLGQIGGTMFLASGRTHEYMLLSSITMLIAIPLSYLILAPSSAHLIPGLGLGAVGLALKMVVLGIFSVNLQAWFIARYHGWKFDWTYQVVGIGFIVGIAFLAKRFIGLFWSLNEIDKFSFLVPFSIGSLLYVLGVAAVVWSLPWLIGMEREEIKGIIKKMVNYFG